MRTRREFIVLLGGAAAVRRSSAQDRPARILYFTHSAGYRHDVISTSRDVLQRIGATADFQITMSEDVAVFTTENCCSEHAGILTAAPPSRFPADFPYIPAFASCRR